MVLGLSSVYTRTSQGWLQFGLCLIDRETLAAMGLTLNNKGHLDSGTETYKNYLEQANKDIRELKWKEEPMVYLMFQTLV
jgi:hypothetical protein